MIWGDETEVDIDLKRYLLIHIYSIGWKGGFLFPTKDEILNRPDDGIFTTCITESGLKDGLKLFYKDVLGREDKLLGHTGRKTGYLWLFLRGVQDLSTATKEAGHDNQWTAQTYIRDAKSHVEAIRTHGEKEQQLGPFKSNYSAGDESCELACSEESKKYQKPLDAIARGFFEVLLGVQPDRFGSGSIRYLYDKAVAWRLPGERPRFTLMVCDQILYAMIFYIFLLTIFIVMQSNAWRSTFLPPMVMSFVTYSRVLCVMREQMV